MTAGVAQGGPGATRRVQGEHGAERGEPENHNVPRLHDEEPPPGQETQGMESIKPPFCGFHFLGPKGEFIMCVFGSFA